MFNHIARSMLPLCVFPSDSNAGVPIDGIKFYFEKYFKNNIYFILFFLNGVFSYKTRE